MWCDFSLLFLFLPQNLSPIKIVDLKFDKPSHPWNAECVARESVSYTCWHCLLSSTIPRVRPITNIRRASTPSVKPWYVARMPWAQPTRFVGAATKAGQLPGPVIPPALLLHWATTAPFHVSTPVAEGLLNISVIQCPLNDN
jgi:hypothetical protein